MMTNPSKYSNIWKYLQEDIDVAKPQHLLSNQAGELLESKRSPNTFPH